MRQVKNMLKRGLRLAQRNFHSLQMAQLNRRAEINGCANEKILFWIPGGMEMMLHVEGAIATAVRLRGGKVHAIICDGAYQACIKREAVDGIPMERWAEQCVGCKRDAAMTLRSIGVPFSYIGDYVSVEKRAELRRQAEAVSWDNILELNYKGVPIGNNVRSAVLRYLKGTDRPENDRIVKEYSFSALVCAASAEKAFDTFKPTQIFTSHGIYVDWGPALQLALARGIPITGWMGSYLPSRFYFRHVDDGLRIDFHKLSDAAWVERERTPLTPAQDAALSKYLQNRYTKNISFDMKEFNLYRGNVQQLREKYKLSTNKPVWGIMTHINWDCVCDYSPMAYDSLNEWILDTIEQIKTVTDVHWIIKIHPYESKDNATTNIEKLIDQRWPTLPPHIQLMRATEDINPLEFFELIDGGITVYGTSGLEVALAGKPVILAGEAHYGGKGYTHDGLTRETYHRLLREAAKLGPLSEEQKLLAKKYAYCYFIQRQIPLPVVEDPATDWYRFRYDRRESLLAGRDRFVDFICQRLIDKKDFVMDEQLTELSGNRDGARL